MSSNPPVIYDALFYLAVSAFWLFVVGLDLICLFSLRRSRVEATARVLWVIWIVVAPVVGAVSYFMVRPTHEEGETRPRDWSFHETGVERQR